MTAAASLRDFRRKLTTLPAVVAIDAARRAAPRLTELARQSFDAGQTPYGDPWLPGSDGAAVDLHETGRLRGTVFYVAAGRLVRATVAGVKYARYQVGKRRVLPAPGQKVPASWKAALDSSVNEAIAQHMGGAS